ncbi:ABC transporter substrate-binding protein [Thermoflavimicrobium dichotomicum]|uniref:Multiple sugar transport system substrate-binding protein n=1 Tax=Thermoflavimicrobium dichotomicum TaxID=46223 RepID=A0A1I3S7C0_9BACL|nr:ABC transporter substrate-binding protein [Thermoflavimicrobium dichotomicum]SFJ53457.1 multiple sugar transport system substrate-binding protein [Thermoflavimicrobium dichotomicum]
MNRWKKGLAACLIMFLVFMTACSTGGKGEGETSKEGKVTIVWAYGKDNTGENKKIVEAFKKTHPNIDVKVKEMPSDTGQNHDQLVTMFSAKSSEIDVMNLDVIWPAEFASAGYLEPLDRFIEKDKVKLDEYIPGAVEAGKVNGQQYAIPRFVDAGLLFYRKDVISTPPKTWDELVQKAKEAKSQGKTKFGYLMQGKQYEGLVCNFLEFISSYGGQILDQNGNVAINTPESVKGLKKMVEVARSEFVPTNISTFTEEESHTAFIQGQSAMIRNWPYQYAIAQDAKQSKIVGKIDVAPLPKGDKKAAATLGGWMAGINKYSKHKKEAWEFLKFVAGAEGQKMSAVIGGKAPAYLPAYNDAEVQKASPLFSNKNFVNGISSAVPRPISPIYPKISDVIQIEVSKAITGKQSAEDAIKNIDAQLKKLVK